MYMHIVYLCIHTQYISSNFDLLSMTWMENRSIQQPHSVSGRDLDRTLRASWQKLRLMTGIMRMRMRMIMMVMKWWWWWWWWWWWCCCCWWWWWWWWWWWSMVLQHPTCENSFTLWNRTLFRLCSPQDRQLVGDPSHLASSGILRSHKLKIDPFNMKVLSWRNSSQGTRCQGLGSQCKWPPNDPAKMATLQGRMAHFQMTKIEWTNRKMEAKHSPSIRPQ